jgi:hypothetical protein
LTFWGDGLLGRLLLRGLRRLGGVADHLVDDLFGADPLVGQVMVSPC